jgi:death on curing protein
VTEPIWLKRAWVYAIHFQQLQRFGGRYGVRDAGVIDAALARPQNLLAYQNATDLADLAAAYGYGLTRGYSYVDGNKRIGFVAMAVFLELNGRRLEAPEPDVVRVMLAVASGEFTQAELTDWVRRHLVTPGETPETFGAG